MIEGLKLINIIDGLIRFLYYSLFFFTPLAMASFTSELFEFNKMIFIYLSAVIISFWWSAKMILAKSIIVKKTPFDIPIILFLISLVLSTIFSIDKHTSLFGYYGRFNGGLFSIVAYLVLFYALVSNVDRETVKKIIKISLLSSFIVILWGLTGKVGFDLSCFIFVGQLNNQCWTDQFRPAERMFSTLGQPNWLGAYLSIHFFIGLYFFLTDQNEKLSSQIVLKATNVFMYIYLVMNFSAILFTRSRSTLLSLVIGLILFFLFTTFTRREQLKKLVILSLLLVVSFMVFKTGIPSIDRLLLPDLEKNMKSLESMSNIKGNQSMNVTTSYDIRKIVWKGAIELGLQYPLFGTGVETFAYSYYFVRPKEHNLTSEWDYLYNKAHNEFLNYFATTGFSGLITYLVFILAVIYFCIKKSKNLFLTTLLLSFLMILITNFFGFSTTTIQLFFFLIPAFMFISSEKSREKNDHVRIQLSKTQFIGLTAAAGIALFFLYYLLNYYIADIYYSAGDKLIKSNKYGEAAQTLLLAEKLKPEHVYEDKLSYTLANFTLLSSYSNDQQEVRELRNLAEEYNQKSLKTSPNSVLYLKTKAKNYFIFYQLSSDIKDLKTGIAALQEARSLAPTDPKIFYSLALFNSLHEENETSSVGKEVSKKLALDSINTSILLKPNYRDGYFLKSQLLRKYGQSTEAKITLQYILDKIDPNDQEVIKELASF